MKPNVLKIIVIDNDISLHETYKYYFETYEEYSLVGIYVSVKEALMDYDNVLPDIIASEVTMPDGCGIEAIRLFRKKDPEVKIVMISGQNDFEIVKKAFKNMANGYVSKPLGIKSLYHALNAIKYEGATISNDIAKKIIAMFQPKSYASFSERENQIIDYLCQGATYRIIADNLFVTPSTVNFHIQNIYLKLNVNSKSEALSKLREMEYSAHLI
ncbi:response regulator transcription factor [Arenibacter troitsensis]|uniref:DNA-binding response regulator, NarL/FixJ family, contains REC and HTH domains n=1 Tax=Arenibacter troitsensis TaxID=188872 RepID=A0A1X7JDN7_9FLAO|nr:response regulator transcription factor [Arenibacter troitsensis]MDX1766503.1 response regulator transcription factor [Arenibacter troitsensis]SMG25545.1 DNA-binding response regulator, NarL/FixJ family, contains REC and HTH domains [Arenibacter troitsensis]